MKTACHLTSYDYGVKVPFKSYQYERWEHLIDFAIKNGPTTSTLPSHPSTTPLAPNHQGSIACRISPPLIKATRDTSAPSFDMLKNYADPSQSSPS